jgi:telomerase reverse transcriptase
MYLLQATFYITESSASRNRVLYFRQDDWESLCQPLIGQFTEKMFQKIEKVSLEFGLVPPYFELSAV